MSDKKPSLESLGLDSPIETAKPKTWQDVANEADQQDFASTIRCRNCNQLIHRESEQCAYCKVTVQHPLITVPATQKPLVQICRFCRSKVDSQAIKCPHCQAWIKEQWNGIAAILSFIVPGLGQMYRGHVFNGICLLICTIIGYFFFVIPGLVIHLLVVIEAGRPANN
jgi:RNA polymerase subunit RPABC4/transcription elongation factor Spt4